MILNGITDINELGLIRMKTRANIIIGDKYYSEGRFLKAASAYEKAEYYYNRLKKRDRFVHESIKKRILSAYVETASVIIQNGGSLVDAERFLKTESENVSFIRLDVKNPKECEKAVRDAEIKWGRLDCLVNSAGVYLEESAEELTEESYSRIMDTNIKGTMFMSKYALPLLKKQKGNIVNVSSDAGLHGNFGCSL